MEVEIGAVAIAPNKPLLIVPDVSHDMTVAVPPGMTTAKATAGSSILRRPRWRAWRSAVSQERFRQTEFRTGCGANAQAIGQRLLARNCRSVKTAANGSTLTLSSITGSSV